MKKDSKELLFEMMNKINPVKIINEDYNRTDSFSKKMGTLRGQDRGREQEIIGDALAYLDDMKIHFQDELNDDGSFNEIIQTITTLKDQLSNKFGFGEY